MRNVTKGLGEGAVEQRGRVPPACHLWLDVAKHIKCTFLGLKPLLRKDQAKNLNE